ncbi:MAG: M15 family metallopeptidase [Clostridia bacterium]|nr:M15 family metallopeptidase [Clostridia bacterium]
MNIKHMIALLCLALCFCCLTGACTDTNTPISNYDYSIDMKPYSKYINTTDKQYLVLLNKTHPSGEHYAPADLVKLDNAMTLYGKEIELRKYPAMATEALIKELHARGYTDIVVTSGYRSYSYQQSLFNTYVEQEMTAHPDWTRQQAEQQVLTYSAAPGTSEHHTGDVIDLISVNYVSLDETFAQNPAYEWLVANAHHFGFILRYPADKTHITGYSYEPWHYRFVGVKAATEIYEQGLTLEEYLGELD